MSLDMLQNFDVPKDGTGYQVRTANKDGTFSPLFGQRSRTMKFLAGVKYSAQCFEPIVTAIEGKRYMPGFHIFLDLKDAKKFASSGEVVCKIKGESLLHTGYQFNGKIAVYDYCTILEVV